MAGIDLTLTFEDGELRQAMADTRARLGDLSAPLDEIGSYLEDRTLERFETGQAPDGTPWLPSQRAVAEGGQTLVDKGHLRDSMNPQVEGDSVVIGSNRPYAAIHQFGGTIRAKSGGKLRFELPGGGVVFTDKVDIPARPFLGVNEDDLDEIETILANFLSQDISDVGGGDT
ncbi:phage virion morphogenesis protein [Pyruvatibacter sp.]|uniref:phage virion morphogenesis protein n=1 Tax=Pyruvatibacter sp. TaxID=1981328 RepID=UPI0032F09733